MQQTNVGRWAYEIFGNSPSSIVRIQAGAAPGSVLGKIGVFSAQRIRIQWSGAQPGPAGPLVFSIKDLQGSQQFDFQMDGTASSLIIDPAGRLTEIAISADPGGYITYGQIVVLEGIYTFGGAYCDR